MRTQGQPDRVSEEVVRSIQAPPRTNSWNPIPHSTCIDIVQNTVEALGVKVLNRLYSIGQDGAIMYSAWAVTPPKMAWAINQTSKSNRLYPAIVFRNSINKALSFGINAGTFAYVCDNLAWNGKFIEFRKHTRCLTVDELNVMATRTVTNLIPEMGNLIEWHQSLRNFQISEETTKFLAYEAIHAKVISLQKLPVFHNLLFGENHSYDPHTMFGFHGACTEVLRDLSFTGELSLKQAALNTLVNKHMTTQQVPAEAELVEIPPQSINPYADEEPENS